MNKIFLRKPLALLLACALAASVFAGCSKSSKDEYLVDSGNKKTKITSLATIEGQPVKLSEFKASLLPMKASYEQQFGGTEIWAQAPDIFTALKDSALESIRMDRVIEKFAIENNMTLTAEQKTANIDKFLVEMQEYLGSEAEMISQLEASGMTMEKYREQLNRQVYSIWLTKEMAKPDGIFAPTDEEVTTTLKNDYLRAKHILIGFDTLESEEAALARANEAYARVQKGEDFDALITEYGTDPGMQSNPEGYYFADGEMVTEFYEGTKALAENAISQPIKSTFGYHIIQRLPIEDSYITANKDAMKTKIGTKKVNDELMARLEASPIEKTPEFELVTINNIGE